MAIFLIILAIIAAYLLGSIPFSLLVARLMAGVDIRSQGSGNVGATNVLRTLGTKGAVFALLGDMLKGVAAVLLGLLISGEGLAAVCGVLAIIGHCYPVFLGFKGGKGVATSAGIILFLMPKIVIILLIVFLIIVFLSRYVSLASITIAILFPVLAISYGYNNAYILMSLIMAIIVVFKHRENIKRLRDGNENKVGQRV
ncbi:MAG: glycerol-3-phosphate 1-O-acyltransferase PlsY [Syntrophomonadaceae bacterium]|nr:glycerol-3-phosphate 1-O-acyltransferase PlsY [Syntrophomonadaceae bacterium]